MDEYIPGIEEKNYTNLIFSKNRDLKVIIQLVDIGINFRNKHSDKNEIEEFFKCLNDNFDKLLSDVMKG